MKRLNKKVLIILAFILTCGLFSCKKADLFHKYFKCRSTEQGQCVIEGTIKIVNKELVINIKKVENAIPYDVLNGLQRFIIHELDNYNVKKFVLAHDDVYKAYIPNEKFDLIVNAYQKFTESERDIIDRTDLESKANKVLLNNLLAVDNKSLLPILENRAKIEEREGQLDEFDLALEPEKLETLKTLGLINAFIRFWLDIDSYGQGSFTSELGMYSAEISTH